MKLKKIAALLLSLTLCAGALVGCSGDEPVQVDAKPAAYSNDGHTAQLTVGELAQNNDRGSVLREIADKYEADYANTQIEILSFGSEDELKAALSNGTVDIAEVTSDTQYEYIDEGLLYDFYNELADWDEFSTLTPAAEFVVFSAGKTHAYLLPNDILQDLLYLRGDWFEEYNADESHEDISFRIWNHIAGYYREDEWVTGSAKALGENGGFAFAGKEKLVDIFNSMVWSAVLTGRMCDPSAAYFSGVSGTTTVFELEQAKKAAEQFISVIENAAIEGSTEWTEDQAVAAFCNGEAAMLLADRSYYYQIEASLPEDALRVEGYPRGLSGTAVVQPEYFSGWGISAQSDEKSIAMHFLTFLSNADNNTHYAKECQTYPIHLEAATLEESLEETAVIGDINAAGRSDWYQYASVPAMYAANDGFEETADKILRLYISGDATADEVLDYFSEYWSNALANEGKLWE